MGLAQVVASCMVLASQMYNVPPAILLGILQVEGGRVGQEVRNTNGSYDLGPMQINTVWVPELAKAWNVDPKTAKTWIRDDACTNIHVSAWILKNHYRRTRDYKQAIAHYHSRTPKYGSVYQGKVLQAMEQVGYKIDDVIKAPKAPAEPYKVAAKIDLTKNQP